MIKKRKNGAGEKGKRRNGAARSSRLIGSKRTHNSGATKKTGESGQIAIRSTSSSVISSSARSKSLVVRGDSCAAMASAFSIVPPVLEVVPTEGVHRC